ncbi:ABC-2 type transport system permease protein/fluoroquinolone transport system permease protein [Anaerovirgula multivorans]|uniref:ABC-2 type transport system permease protein/fluoroquinolone transport system permease protein n=1 Tax=Anaerovirgula multivorans TaxID=312168 RepID=A0A239AIG1_9FIRM|nr:ABC transporter permease [Anaerovirgula multivorans]SNR94808.1 ABC-2 type transport system permease protein/fluoroquinolone transport system permease protein [Anaerovirgula multivorans]
MLARFTNLIKQDLTVTFRNYFHYAIILLAILMIVVINLIVPESVKLTPNEVFYDGTEEKTLQQFLLQEGLEESQLFPSKEALFQEVEEEDNTIGIIMEGDLENPKFTILYQGRESVEIINLLSVTIEEALNRMRGVEATPGYRVEYLRSQAEPIPFNKSLVPMMLVLEPVMLGFILIAVMIFQEKEEGSLRAYRVSPAGTMQYILSKVAVITLLALLYSGLLLLFTMGLDVNYLKVLLMIILSNFLITLIGLSISVFFKNLEEFLFVAVLILAILGLPMVSYFTPTFTPDFITWLPSYSMLFGIREIIFPTGKQHYVTALQWGLILQALIMLAVSYWVVHKQLMKEGK